MGGFLVKRVELLDSKNFINRSTSRTQYDEYVIGKNKRTLQPTILSMDWRPKIGLVFADWSNGVRTRTDIDNYRPHIVNGKQRGIIFEVGDYKFLVSFYGEDDYPYCEGAG